MKLKSKFIFFMLFLNVLIAFSAFAIIYLMSSKYILQGYTEHVKQASTYFKINTLDNLGKRALNYARLVENNTPAATYIENFDKDKFLENFSSYIKSKSIDYIIIFDKDKNILSGRYNSSFKNSVLKNCFTILSSRE